MHSVEEEEEEKEEEEEEEEIFKIRSQRRFVLHEYS